MSMASPLPANWADILDEMHARLDQAIAAAQERTNHLNAPAAESTAAQVHPEWDAWQGRLNRLQGYLESAEQIAQSVDESLAREESALRESLSRLETLRQERGRHIPGV